MDFEKLISEYSESYCEMLETAYGPGMMSEGGAEAIETMFKGLEIDHKTALDIGFGLAGVPFYLAQEHHMHATGIEVNPWLVEEATRRTPEVLATLLDFIVYKPHSPLPFSDNHFDIVFSKGVLTHLDKKDALFEEVYRVLKPGGYFVVNDWLSPYKDRWGARVQMMCERENLSLFAETKENYVDLFKKIGFKDVDCQDESLSYAKYNREIAERLQSKATAHEFSKKFGEVLRQEFVDSYQLIAEAMEEGELIVTLFKARKP